MLDKYNKDIITFRVNSENIINEVLNYAMPKILKEFEPYKNKVYSFSIVQNE